MLLSFDVQSLVFKIKNNDDVNPQDVLKLVMFSIGL